MSAPGLGDLLASPGNASLLMWNCSPPPELLVRLSGSYQEAHKYLATILCSVGAATNLLNMAVFCQRAMRNPTNSLLTALALSDCLLSMSYLPFCLYFTMRDRLKLACPEPYPWQLFLWVQVCLAILAHSCSAWITVALAVFRLIYIELPVRSKQLCTNRTSLLSIALAVAASAAMVAPNAFEHHVTVAKVEDVRDRRQACRLEANATYYKFELKLQDSVLSSLNFWIIGLGIKFLPVLLLTLLSVFLVRSLRRTGARRKLLRAGLNSPTGAASDAPGGSSASAGAAGQSETDRQTNRTTKILITIVLVSVISVWPQAIMLIVLGSSKDKDCFSKRFYDPLGDVFDLMTLFNHSINFIFYYGMSEQFRLTFGQLFSCAALRGRRQSLPGNAQRGRRQVARQPVVYAVVNGDAADEDAAVTPEVRDTTV